MNIELLLLAGPNKVELICELHEFLSSKGLAMTAVFVPDSQKYNLECSRVAHCSRELGIRTIVAAPSSLLSAVSELQFNVMFSCGYPFTVPEAVLKKPDYAINFHPTLLPRHRGRYLHWIILDGDDESGVTAHFMNKDLDSGDIVRQMKFAVSKFDTVQSLLRKSACLERQLATHVLEDLLHGRPLTGVRQEEALVTSHFQKRIPEDSQIDPSKPLLELYDQIRACHPDLYPAFFEIEGQKVGVKLFRLDKPTEEFDLV